MALAGRDRWCMLSVVGLSPQVGCTFEAWNRTSADYFAPLFVPNRS